MSEEIISLSASEIAFKIKSKEITVTQTVNAFLQRIEQINPLVNAISDIRKKEDILNEAKEKDLQIKENKNLGILFGVPITIKESFLVKGLKTTNGDPMLRNYIAKEDAELVKRLKNAGAIIIGMTNVAFFCIDWQSTNFWNGQTNNPFDLSRVAGGSSGGSSVAVASNLVPLSLGADAGGSVRVPAHFCGICGLKPTEELLSNRGHLKYPNKPQGRRHIITPGPFAKNIDDIILMMNVLADNQTYPLAEIPDVGFDKSQWSGEKLNIAISETINNTEVDKEYLTIFREFINKIKKTEHILNTDHPSYNEKEAYVACSKIIGFGIGVNNPKVPLLSAFMYLFIRFKYKDHLWAKGMAKGQRLTNTQYAKALDIKDEFTDTYNSFLIKYDIWITPVCSMEAYKHQKAGKPFVINGNKIGYTKAIASFVFTTAFSGHPIVVIPIGKKENGMPVGIQIHSKKWTDRKLLDIAKYFERFTDKFISPRIKNKDNNIPKNIGSLS